MVEENKVSKNESFVQPRDLAQTMNPVKSSTEVSPYGIGNDHSNLLKIVGGSNAPVSPGKARMTSSERRNRVSQSLREVRE